MKTYNNYLTKGIIDGSIKERYQDGVRIYEVRRPMDGEEVVGYCSFSAFSHDHTPTEIAGRKN